MFSTRQSQHMNTWLITRKAGYVPDSFQLEHAFAGYSKDENCLKLAPVERLKLTDLLMKRLNRINAD